MKIMDKLVSLYESSLFSEDQLTRRIRIEGYISRAGEIFYILILNNANTCPVTKIERDKIIGRYNMLCRFDNEVEAEHEFAALGLVL